MTRNRKHTLLSELGLNQSMIDVYLCLLEQKKATIMEISKKTGISRTNLYHITEKLIDMGILGHAIEGKKKLLVPEPPASLIQMIKAKESIAQQAVDLLQDDFDKNKVESRIKFGHGPEDFMKFAKQVLNAKEMPVRQLINFEALTGYTTEKILGNYWQKRIAKKIYIKILMPNSEKILMHKKYTSIDHIKMFREIRFLPDEIKLETSFINYDQYTHLFAPPEEGYIFSYKSESFSKTIKNIFDYFWNISDPYEE